MPISTESEGIEDESDYPYKFLRETQLRNREAERLLDVLRTSTSESSIDNTTNLILLRVLQSYKKLVENKTRNSTRNNRLSNSKNHTNVFKFIQVANESEITTQGRQRLLLPKFFKSDNVGEVNGTERRIQQKRFPNDDIINLVQVNHTAKSYKHKYADQWKRKPRQLDTYAESLLYVNRIYNLAYGFQRRRVPAHMPHLLDKWIINDMQEKFQDEFKKTSSHKVRSAEDMQFAFSYFYFVASEKRNLPVSEIFNIFDTDKSE